MGILTGQSNAVADFLQSNAEYNQLYMNYIISSLSGNNMSVIELLNKAMAVFEHEFGVIPSSIAEMETVLKENNLFRQEEVETEMPFFEPPSIDEIPTFSEIDIGKATIDVPVEQKEQAQKYVMGDDLEQGNIIIFERK